MSDEHVQEAVVLLRQSDEQKRKAAAKVIAKMGPSATSAVALQLTSKDAGIRAVAAELLGYMGTKVGEEYIENLAKLLEDEDGIARRAAVAAVGALGEPGRAKAADVAKLLQDSDTDVRRLAVEALRRMEPAAQEHVNDVLGLLNDPAWTVRRSAVEAVGSMGDAAFNHAEEIASKLKDEEWLVRGAAAEALGRLGDHAAKHSADIQLLLSDKEWFVRNVAAEALHSLGKPGQKLLEIHHEGLRSSAAEQLATRFQPERKGTEEPLSPVSPGLGKLHKPAVDKRRGRTVTTRGATKAVHAHQSKQNATSEDAKQLAQAIDAHKQKSSAGVRSVNDARAAEFYAGMTSKS
jgi:HEAT repeat protein